jgi:hypothetical protein
LGDGVHRAGAVEKHGDVGVSLSHTTS